MGLDEVDEFFVGNGKVDAFLDAILANVQIDFPRSSADVAKVRVRHFAGPVHDASHDRDLDALQVSGLRADALGGGLKVKEGPSAGRTGNVLGLRDPYARRLQNVVEQFEVLLGMSACSGLDQVPDTVAQQGPQSDRRVDPVL